MNNVATIYRPGFTPDGSGGRATQGSGDSPALGPLFCDFDIIDDISTNSFIDNNYVFDSTNYLYCFFSRTVNLIISRQITR